MSRQEVHEAIDDLLATAEYEAARARDQAIAERDEARKERDTAIAERNALRAQLDALSETVAMTEMPNIPWTASGNKDRQGRPVRTWLPGTPEHDPADPLRVEYVESIQFMYSRDSEVRVVIETDETDGGIRRLSGHCYHSALVITAKELLDMACWTYEAETKNTAARVRREVANSVGEKRYAGGFNAGYDQGPEDARKEMADDEDT